MTRPTKIRIAVALVVLGGLAWALWPGEEEGALTVSYAGVASNDPTHVFFTLTNESKSTFRYFTYWVTEKPGGSPDVLRMSPLVGQVVASHTSTNHKFAPSPAKEWVACVVYGKDGPDPVLYRARISLGMYARKHDWTRLAHIVLPQSRLKYAFGPPMLGNQPAPLAK